MKKSYILIVCIILIIFFVIGCPQSKPEIIVGDEVEVTSEIIEEGGGTIVVDKPGDPLDGFTLEVPEGSYSESKTFKISYRPIEDHNLGSTFNPLSPLIEVDNGSDYSEELMTVTIPVSIPADHFAMAFFYDETTGKLEGIPVIDQDEASLSVTTRHFSKLTVSSIAAALLFGEIDTGFKHGVDDWQFANTGSYIAPGGHCAGQSIAAMYYYTEKKLKEGKPQLYGTYDNDNFPNETPEIWQDDVRAYSLCSSIQKSTDWDNRARKWWFERQEEKGPLYTYFSFAYAMLLTGEPQYVSIIRTTEKGNSEVHAMVVYKKSGRVNKEGYEGSVLFVSDPNYPYPEPEQEIIFDLDNEEFKPYNASSKKGASIDEYPEIYYMGKNAIINKFEIDLLWEEFEAGTIRNVLFPDYTVYICKKDSASNITDCKELVDGYQVTPYAYGYCFKAEVDGKEAELEIYDEGQKYICEEEHTVDFKEGSNFLGFYIKADVTWKDADEEEKTTTEWVGFDWLDVMYEEGETETFAYAAIEISDLELSGYYEEDAESCQDGWSDPHATVSVKYMENGIINGTTFTATWEADPENIYELTSGDVEINFKDDSLTEITSFNIKSFTSKETLKEISFKIEATGLSVQKDESSSTENYLNFVQDGCGNLTFNEYQVFYPYRKPCKTKVLETVECSSNSKITIYFSKE